MPCPARTRYALTDAEPARGLVRPVGRLPTNHERKQDVAQPIIVLAGAAGDLGARIAKALVGRGTAVRALVRNDVSAADRNRLSALGLTVMPADIGDAG